MNLREAAQQALKALENLDEQELATGDLMWLGKEIGDLRAALAEEAMQRMTDVQQEMESTSQESRQVEPVATINKTETVEPVAWISYESLGRLKNGGNSRGAVPVHTIQSHTAKIPLYTAPPKREPLTDEEIEALVLEWWCPTMVTAKDRKFARAIERAHGIGGEE